MASLNTRDNKSSKGKVNVDDEVQKLLGKGVDVLPGNLKSLKYNLKDDELVEKIQNEFASKQRSIMKKAKKFAQLIREKYGNSGTPFHTLLEKAHKYKTKHGLTNDEFAEFQRLYEQDLIGLKEGVLLLPTNNLQKLLGSITLDVTGQHRNLNDKDAAALTEIMKIHAESKTLHSQVLIQSMHYKDCDYEALSGSYNRDIHNVNEHVHPVVAALFLPKFDIIEKFFVFANLAGIIKSRFESKILTSRADYEVFHALTSDPNDVVCDSKSVISDMLNRVKLQIQLWNSVLHLRNGQYYSNNFGNFVATVDMCRLNKQDTPDLVYGRYDGIIIKRLLSAFSFRPSVVATTPIHVGMVNTVSVNPYLMNVRPVVTNVPMINLRLPPVLHNNLPEEINLQNAIQQEQYFLEGGTIVPRNTSLIWSRGILIFYVDRRSIVVQNNHMDAFSMNRLPQSAVGIERINKRVVKTPLDGLMVREESYELRSVIISEVHKIKENNKLTPTAVVVGSSTLIRKPDGLNGNPMYYVYDPLAPSQIGDVYSNGGPLKQNATARRYTISSIKETDEDDDCSFVKLAETQGTVYIYSSNTNESGEYKLNLSNAF